MGQGPDAESGESHICCKQPDGWVKDWDRPRMETGGVTVMPSARVKESFDYAAAAHSINEDTS